MTKEELIKKLRELEQRGVGGEKDNASKLLKKLMDKYGITGEDLLDEKVDYFFAKYSGTYERKLLCQIMYMVTGDGTTYTSRCLKSQIGCRCTKPQSLEILALFSFFKDNLKKDMDIFYHAFVQKNNLFPANGEKKDPDEEDLKALKMALGLDCHEFRYPTSVHPQITDGKKLLENVL